MSQSGYTPILIYGSTTASNVPLAANLTTSSSGVELAINAADGKLFYKDSGGTVQVIATKAGALGTVTSVSGTGTVNGLTLTGTVTTSGSLTLGGTLDLSSPPAIGSTTPNTGSFTSLTDSGNLTFTGTGNRILGDFSNATVANRVWIQSSTTNGDTNLYIVPNGTSTQSGVAVFNASTLTNAAYFNASITSSAATLDSGKFGTGTYLPMTFNTSGSERMRLDTSGNLGIGISAPSVRLDIVGSQYWRGAAAAGAVGIMTPDPTSGANGVNLAASFSTGGYGPLTFSTAATERMRIDSSGNVGIGVSSPADTASYGGKVLDIKGPTYLRDTSGGSNYFSSGVVGGATYLQANGTSNFLAFSVNNAERMRIDSSGNVLVTNPAGLGYGTGSGGTVTQATSKATTVTLNKPTGQITMNNAALGAGLSVSFSFFSSLITATDTVIVNGVGALSNNYRIEFLYLVAGGGVIRVTNISAGSLSDALQINFAIIKGATS